MTRKALLFTLFSALILQAHFAFAQYTGGDFAGYSSSRSDDIIYDGTTPQVTGDELPDIVNNLTIANPTGVTLSKSITVNGKLSVLNGDFNLNGNTITLGGNASVLETPGNTIFGGAGDVSVTQDLNDIADGKNVSGLGLILKSEVPLGTTTVARGHSQQEITKNKIGASRYFDVTPANEESLNVFVEFFYDESEVAGIPENDLALFILHDDEETTQGGLAKGASALAEKNWELLGGNVDTQTRAVCKGGIGDFSRLTIARGFAILAAERVIVQSNIYSEGDIHSNGDIYFGKSNQGNHVGNLSAAGNVSIYNGNTISGDVYAGKNLSLGKKAKIIGDFGEEFVQPIDLPAPLGKFTGEAIVVKSGEIVKLDPGDYAYVYVKPQGTLKLTSGEYRIRELDFGDNSGVIIDVSAGPVNILTRGWLRFDGTIDYRIEPGGESNSNLVTFTSMQRREICIDKNTAFFGWLIAPHARVELGKSSIFKGSIVAREAFVEKGAGFYSHGFNQPLHKAAAGQEEQMAMLDNDAGVESFALHQNYPNPFNANTIISFQLKESTDIKLKIYDTTGRLIRMLQSGTIAAGSHRVVWNGKDEAGVDVASGVYFYALESKAFTLRKKLLLLK